MPTTTSPAAMLAEFHNALGLPFGHGTIADSSLRIKLHREETKELIEALRARDRVPIAQELADVVYVSYGTAHSLGIKLDTVAVTPPGPGGVLDRFSGLTLELILSLLSQEWDGVAQSLSDLVGDAYLTAASLRIPLDRVLAEVHAANMRKIGPDGPILRFDGKLLKPDGWTPPDVAAVLAQEDET